MTLNRKMASNQNVKKQDNKKKMDEEDEEVIKEIEADPEGSTKMMTETTKAATAVIDDDDELEKGEVGSGYLAPEQNKDKSLPTDIYKLKAGQTAEQVLLDKGYKLSKELGRGG